MEISIKNGSILSGGDNVVAHQVNCVGVMGSGVALAIRDKYPRVYTEYLEFCNKKMDHIMIGNDGYTIIKAVPIKKGYGDKTDDYSLEIEEDEEIKNTAKETNDDVESDDEPITANSYALF
jgi:hypothetical protein